MPHHVRRCARTLLQCGSFITWLPAAFAAQTIVADSAITSVTVYRGSAVITREATVNLETGLQTIAFNRLPPGLDPNLVQVSGSGTAQATILEVIVAETHQPDVVNPRVQELQKQMRALQDENQAASDQKSALLQQRDYLERIKNVTTTQPGGDAPALPGPAQWDQLLAFYGERQVQLAAELRKIERALADLKERIDAVEREIEDLDGSEERATQNVIVRCEVARAGSLTVVVTYSVDEAGWEPVYDIRVASADKAITLAYAANVTQSTGEDWRGVRLALSTAEPDRNGTPPVFNPWIVEDLAALMARSGVKRKAGDPLQYATATEVTGVYGNFAGLGNVDKLPAVEVVEEAGTAAATVASGLTSSTFTIPFPADIPADNFSHRVGIGTTALTGMMNHLAMPKLAERVFLRARVTNTAAFPLVDGEVSIFLDGTFVSRAEMSTVMPGGKFVLNLGVDDGITTKRRLVNRLVENTGAFAKRARITYDAVLTVENNHRTPETVIVKDQMPVSRHEKIVVTLVAPAASAIVKEEEATEDGAVRRADDGTISWTVKLKPGEKRELPLKITVEYPTDLAVAGLE